MCLEFLGDSGEIGLLFSRTSGHTGLHFQRDSSYEQCDQIGRFLKFLVQNFLSNIAQINGPFLCHFQNSTYKLQTAVTVLGNFCREWGYFLV